MSIKICKSAVTENGTAAVNTINTANVMEENVMDIINTSNASEKFVKSLCSVLKNRAAAVKVADSFIRSACWFDKSTNKIYVAAPERWMIKNTCGEHDSDDDYTAEIEEEREYEEAREYYESERFWDAMRDNYPGYDDDDDREHWDDDDHREEIEEEREYEEAREWYERERCLEAMYDNDPAYAD